MAGKECCTNPPTLSPGSGEGSVTELGGLKAYVSGSSSSTAAIVLVSDVFGYEAPKLRKIADKVAAAGFYAVVPDFFHGDPFVSGDPERPLAQWMTSFNMDDGVEEAKSLITDLRSKGISAVGAVGFCLGGKLAIELAKTDCIQAVVILHPTFVIAEDVNEVRVPIAVLGAEVDYYSPLELLKEIEQLLSKRPEIDGYVKIFPGMVHGFSLRYKDGDEYAIKSANEAHKDMIEWFLKYVKSSNGDQKFPARL